MTTTFTARRPQSNPQSPINRISGLWPQQEQDGTLTMKFVDDPLAKDPQGNRVNPHGSGRTFVLKLDADSGSWDVYTAPPGSPAAEYDQTIQPRVSAAGRVTMPLRSHDRQFTFFYSSPEEIVAQGRDLTTSPRWSVYTPKEAGGANPAAVDDAMEAAMKRALTNPAARPAPGQAKPGITVAPPANDKASDEEIAF